MSSVNLTNPQLNALCKENGIKGYSKLKKDEKIAMLTEAGVELFNQESSAASKTKKSGEKSSEKKVSKATSKNETDKSKESVKKETKPRVEKLDKKIVKSIDLTKYTEILTDHKEELTYSEAINYLKDDIEEFVNTVDEKECAEFVNKFGALVAINYQRSHKNSKLSSKDDAEIYKILLLDLFLNREGVLLSLFKSFTKLHATLLKPPAEKKQKKTSKKVVRVNPPDEDEDEDETVENNNVRDADEEADDNCEVEEDDIGEEYVNSDDE